MNRLFSVGLTLGLVATFSCKTAHESSHPMLVGGTKDGADSYQSLVRIKINGKTHCTAGKISDRMFITAAHCVTEAVFRQGAYYAQTILEAARPGQQIRLETISGEAQMVTIEATLPHPSFHWSFMNIDNWGADVAIFRVKEETPLFKVAPIDFNRVPAGTVITIGGFGCQKGSLADEEPIENEIRIDESQKVLDRAALLKQDSTKAALSDTIYGALSQPARKLADEAFFTTGSPRLTGTGSSAICPGDSGGPVFLKTVNGIRTIGVNSGMGLSLEASDRLGIPIYNLHTRLSTGGAYRTGEWLSHIINDSRTDDEGTVMAQGQISLAEGVSISMPVPVAPQAVKKIRLQVIPQADGAAPKIVKLAYRLNHPDAIPVAWKTVGEDWEAPSVVSEAGYFELEFSANSSGEYVVLVTNKR